MGEQDTDQHNEEQTQGKAQNPPVQTAQIKGTVEIQQQGAGQGQPPPEPAKDDKGSGDGDKKDGDKKDGDKKDGDKKDEKKSNPLRTLIIVAVVLLLLAGGGFWYWRSTFSEDTDDAQVDGDIYQISSRVQGQVLKVYAQENKPVQKGELLVEIDAKDQQVALENAQANLASAQAQYTQATVNVPITSTSTATQLSNSGNDVRSASEQVDQAQKQAAAAAARVAEAKANAIKANKDVERYKPLVEKDVISRQQYDAAVAAAESSNASVLESESALVAQGSAISQAQEKVQQARNQAEENAKNGPKQVEVQRARAQAALAQVKQAQAQVDQAMLNLSYTRILAPVAGIVNKKNVDVMANLSVGQNLFNIVPLDNLWVTANFKETQLKGMRRCEDVKLKVDALGGREFSGRLTQIGGATGSRLSLFPPENATGNYVKVVQRIPVRIDFTNLQKENGDYALRPGFSVTPEVAVKGTGAENKDTQSCDNTAQNMTSSR